MIRNGTGEVPKELCSSPKKRDSWVQDAKDDDEANSL